MEVKIGQKYLINKKYKAEVVYIDFNSVVFKDLETGGKWTIFKNELFERLTEIIK